MSNLPFVPRVFFRVFFAVLVLLLLGFWLTVRIYGRISTTDIVGASIAAFILVYLIHLWLIPSHHGRGGRGKQDNPGEH